MSQPYDERHGDTEHQPLPFTGGGQQPGTPDPERRYDTGEDAADARH